MVSGFQHRKQRAKYVKSAVDLSKLIDIEYVDCCLKLERQNSKLSMMFASFMIKSHPQHTKQDLEAMANVLL